MRTVEITVPGKPATKGSWRVMPNGALKSDSDRSVAFESAVKLLASQKIKSPSDGSMAVGIDCYFTRPKAHYGKGRNSNILKAGVPDGPTGRQCGDIDKIARAVLDGLTGVAYVDDSQVVQLVVVKEFSDVAKTVIQIREH